MTSVHKFARLSIVALLFLATTVVAQDSKPAGGDAKAADLPAGSELVDRYIEATGGKAALKAITSRKLTGKIAIPAQGMNMSVVLSQKSPDLFHTKLDLGPLGKETSGYTGGVAWTVSTLQGNRLLEGEELANMKRQAAMDADWNWRAHYEEPETIGETMINGEACYEVKLTPKAGGSVVSWFVSKESGLRLRESGTAKTAMGEFEIVSTFSDYREVDGVKYPFRTDMTQAGMKMELTFESVEHGTEMPDSMFAFPEVIQKLIDKKKAKEEKEKGDEGSSEEEPAKSGPASRPGR